MTNLPQDVIREAVEIAEGWTTVGARLVRGPDDKLIARKFLQDWHLAALAMQLHKQVRAAGKFRISCDDDSVCIYEVLYEPETDDWDFQPYADIGHQHPTLAENMVAACVKALREKE